MGGEGHSGITKTHQLKSNFQFHIWLQKGLTSGFAMAPAASTEYFNVLQRFTTGEAALVSAQ